MGSLTPPWADELLSRNTKIARKMMSSMSTESYLMESTSSPSPSPPQRPNRFLSIPVANPSDPISPLPTTPPSSSAYSPPSVPITNGTDGRPKNDGGEKTAKQVVDPSSSSTTSYRMASSQSPISSLSISPTTKSTTCSSSRINLFSSSSSPASAIKQQLSRNTGKYSVKHWKNCNLLSFYCTYLTITTDTFVFHEKKNIYCIAIGIITFPSKLISSLYKNVLLPFCSVICVFITCTVFISNGSHSLSSHHTTPPSFLSSSQEKVCSFFLLLFYFYYYTTLMFIFSFPPLSYNNIIYNMFYFHERKENRQDEVRRKTIKKRMYWYAYISQAKNTFFFFIQHAYQLPCSMKSVKTRVKLKGCMRKKNYV